MSDTISLPSRSTANTQACAQTDNDYRLQRKAEESKKTLENPEAVLYPDLPHPRLPSSASPSSLAGAYYNPGYVTLHLEEKKHENKTILTASMPDFSFPYRLELEHVSGDFWIAYQYIIGGEPIPEIGRASFSIGPDAKPISLTLYPTEGGQVKKVFTRVAN